MIQMFLTVCWYKNSHLYIILRRPWNLPLGSSVAVLPTIRNYHGHLHDLNHLNEGAGGGNSVIQAIYPQNLRDFTPKYRKPP